MSDALGDALRDDLERAPWDCADARFNDKASVRVWDLIDAGLAARRGATSVFQ